MKSIVEIRPWKIIEKGFNTENNLVLESIFSLGNGRLGGRGNIEEGVEADSLLGNYIAGVYYPDKTRVGWWKNGYPEYFAKVLNAVNWVGVALKMNGQTIRLSKKNVVDFYSELDMQQGILRRKCTIELGSDIKFEIHSERFFHLQNKDRCYAFYKVKNLAQPIDVELESYLDFNVYNQDSNYNHSFWNQHSHGFEHGTGWVRAITRKSDFDVMAGMHLESAHTDWVKKENEGYVALATTQNLVTGASLEFKKHVCITSNFYYENIRDECFQQLTQSMVVGYDQARQSHIDSWCKIWRTSDIQIVGDDAAQQGIRFNIFQLQQTYQGDDPRLNIGPKGFTGEKYGGSTYWDTEAYCLPFYMGTSTKQVCRNLLMYRYHHLEKAIENAEKLGFKNGAALYPMVTMNGEECHNEWEITFEEIHRNGAIAYAIYDYTRYYDDEEYIPDFGIDILIAIARFWNQRVNWSEQKQAYVILGVTGPNEFENNVNNNWYTNYIASWCLSYCLECLTKIKGQNLDKYNQILHRNRWKNDERIQWESIIQNMYYPYDEKRKVYLQQDGFLDKELKTMSEIPEGEYPIHQHWSWDRILRSCYIKQADTLQGMYFFEDDFDLETIERHFTFYEPMTVHESSLSPCVHSILACRIGHFDKAYEMYLRTARLDLDDYNHDTKDGLHITSMAGTWMSVVKGFGGMRIKNNHISFAPYLPTNWKQYNFKIRYRNALLEIMVNEADFEIKNHSSENVDIEFSNKIFTIEANDKLSISIQEKRPQIA